MRRCLTCEGRVEDRRRLCPADGDVLVSEGKQTPETGTILDGRYRLGNLIGEGGMGQVFEAVRLASDSPVAVKLLRPGGADARAEKRFRFEAELLAGLDHPGIVKVLESRRSPEGLHYIAMERLLGPTFSELRRAGKLASPDRVVALMTEACEIVGWAHAKGIVHRDIKASNLLLHRVDRQTSRVKVLDFGIAKLLDQGGREGLTMTGEMVGTLMYMAPEQTSGGPLTPAVDVYSLGAVLFEALAGRPPFVARNSIEFLRLQASAPTPALASFRAEISDELGELVGKCLSKKPENRFADASELARALESVRDAGLLGKTLSATRLAKVNPSLIVGSILDERYELHRWIAPGRFGSDVYLATHLHTGVSVAVRVWKTGKGAVRDCLIEAFRNEAKAMGVRHPNLLAIVDMGSDDDCVYFVTEYVESVSLRELLDGRGPLAPDVAVPLVLGTLQALRALHNRKIVSGGLSPETIRVSGTLKQPESLLISPFGLTNLKQVESLLTLPSAAGTGGRDYLEPEQRSGETPEPRSDLYSLGLILLEMLGGRVDEPSLPPTITTAELAPTRTIARMPASRESARREDQPQISLPASLAPEWAAFFALAIASEPERRFQKASEFEAALPRG